jgi:hypothetical protein
MDHSIVTTQATFRVKLLQYATTTIMMLPLLSSLRTWLPLLIVGVVVADTVDVNEHEKYKCLEIQEKIAASASDVAKERMNAW